MRYVLCLLSVAVITCRAAEAQVFEVGAGIGRACVGSEGGLCGDEAAAMPSLHGSVWLDDRLELGIRFATMGRPDVSYAVAHDSRFDVVADPAVRELQRVDVASRDRSRRIIEGDFVYHFKRGSPIRPVLGVGLGRVWNRLTETCAPAGCEQLMPILSGPVGRRSHSNPNLSMIAGLSGRVGSHLEVKGGVRLHNFAGEGTSTAEVFVSTGYQFGSR